MPFVRRRLRRHPLAHWLLVLGLAVLSALVVGRRTADADAARAAWGATKPVVVATRAIDAGATIDADDVALQRWPAAVVGTSALDALPVGRAVRVALAPGDMLRVDDIAPTGVAGLAALIPDGWRAVAVARGTASVAVARGDRVDLVAATADGAAAMVARDALVLAADAKTITVAVPSDVADRVAGALATTAVVAVLRGASG